MYKAILNSKTGIGIVEMKNCTAYLLYTDAHGLVLSIYNDRGLTPTQYRISNLRDLRFDNDGLSVFASFIERLN